MKKHVIKLENGHITLNGKRYLDCTEQEKKDFDRAFTELKFSELIQLIKATKECGKKMGLKIDIRIENI
ncbi:MAG: hypothetical protein ACRCS4_00710 [Flavobacterium sp.]